MEGFTSHFSGKQKLELSRYAIPNPMEYGKMLGNLEKVQKINRKGVPSIPDLRVKRIKEIVVIFATPLGTKHKNTKYRLNQLLLRLNCTVKNQIFPIRTFQDPQE